MPERRMAQIVRERGRLHNVGVDSKSLCRALLLSCQLFRKPACNLRDFQ